MIHHLIIASNPFVDAYIQSDILGKLIFVGLIILSVSSWIVLIHKFWLNYHAKKNSAEFQRSFQSLKLTPLGLECEIKSQTLNPFRVLYSVLKKNTLELLSKNKHFSKTKHDHISFLSPADIDFVEGHLLSTISNQTKFLEKNLFILATIVSLGPFLGLLGTVWGILNTFSSLTTHATESTHQAVLGGLSLALATTVLGLVAAIPALIGYNFLKNSARDFEVEMEGFAHEILASVEMQYRTPEGG